MQLKRATMNNPSTFMKIKDELVQEFKQKGSIGWLYTIITVCYAFLILLKQLFNTAEEEDDTLRVSFYKRGMTWKFKDYVFGYICLAVSLYIALAVIFLKVVKYF